VGARGIFAAAVADGRRLALYANLLYTRQNLQQFAAKNMKNGLTADFLE
jgi:hypothetical protein